ncbi:unnamed protein product [[Actinomadura] parvosata subsp. kistnae]|uniref:SGNH hydrolase-type esterase domain-containing protein n=1 Tax=[Actinomadura] parvosata subsp. kistnae TaxID=1909395 RepID=A0A1U9ZX69_9ACTN|nr:GDSL-type esterase/lipase family protein [Nonomuraea sp. ATCC 55076]AQZ62544.1 hypothetical protein BKM31_14715 [Nonomuraea sp. ATCC 55076]SPL88811.1 unnamed protein product [Actinomadura parvosata subsp. kistnae]
MKTRRTTGRLVLIMSVVVTLLLGLTPPVTAAVPRFVLPSGSAGTFSVAVAAESVTLTLEGGHFDPGRMRDILQETQRRNSRLSDTFREDFQANPHGMEGGGEDFESWPDFNGHLSMTDTSVSVRIEGDQPLTNFSWWAEVLASVAGGLTGLVLRAICIGFFPEAAVMCVSIGGFVGGMTRGIIIQALDGTLKDAAEWAKTLGGAIAMAATGAAWEAGVKNWAKEVLPGHIERLGQEIIRLGRKLASGWARFKQACVDAGNFVADVAHNLGQAISNLQIHQGLRVMPLGDSITYGQESIDGNGYRDDLFGYLKNLARDVNFVGSVRHGTMDDPDNEGHPGDRIDEIGHITDCTVRRYKPNLITLHAGTNDMNQNYNLASAPSRLKSLISQALSTSPAATVLVAKLIPTAKPGLQPRIDAYNAALPGVVSDLQQEGKRVLLVDMKRVLVSDGLQNDAHPTDAGYRKMAAAWFGGVLEAHARGWIRQPGEELPPMACNPADDLDTAPPSGDGTTALGAGWRKLGVIAPGYGHSVGRTIIAELNGDKRADYLQVRDDGSVRTSVNTVGTPGFPDWVDVGTYDPGDHPGDGTAKIDVDPDSVRFADLNGDGRDDYLVVSPDSKVRAYLNFAGTDGHLRFVHHGIAFQEESFNRANLRFADVTGDGRDDILRVSAEGAVHVYRNLWNPDDSGGNDDRGPESSPRGPESWPLWLNWAGGTKGSSLAAVRFADGDGDGAADYLQVSVEGAVHAFLNRGGGGNGSFEPRYDWAHASGYPREYVTFADISGDGRADYLVVYHGGAVRAWLNRGGNQ